MLGELSDVETDYEFKWRPTYEPEPLHMVIPDRFFSCSAALHAISRSAPVVGSKLVLDPVPLSVEDFSDLKQTIEPDIRIVHLTRDYRDVYLSIARGLFINLLRSPVQDTKGKKLMTRLLEFTREKDKWLSSQNRHYIPPGSCEETLVTLYKNDMWISSLQEKYEHYMRIDYRKIVDDFSRVLRFIGSNASRAEILQVLAAPPTIKLPKAEVQGIIENAKEVMELATYYEKTKRMHFRNMERQG